MAKENSSSMEENLGGNMKSLAIIGVRGVPVVYSGFETFAQELAVRWPERGWRVSVFCRNHAVKDARKSYKGVRLIILPSYAS